MIQEVSVESTQETPASSLEPADAPEVVPAAPERSSMRGRSPQPEPLEPVPEEPQEPAPEEPQESQEPEEPPPPPVPKTRVPPRVKPKAKPKAESTQVSAPKAKAKRAPKKTEAPPAEETDRFASFSNTDLMSEMLKRTDQGERRNSTLHTALIAEIIARSNDHRMEQKRAMYRSFLQ